MEFQNVEPCVTRTTLTCYVVFNCSHKVNPTVVGSIAQLLNGKKLKWNAIKDRDLS